LERALLGIGDARHGSSLPRTWCVSFLCCLRALRMAID
jgi:hypothetical protein